MDGLTTAGKPSVFPRYGFPLNISRARASSYGYQHIPVCLTVLVTNVNLVSQRIQLRPTGKGPVVAICPEYRDLLTRLCPPRLGGQGWDKAESHGVPIIRLPWLGLGWGLKLERIPAGSMGVSRRDRLILEARQWLDQLNRAWNGAMLHVEELAWRVFLPHHPESGPLDAVSMEPLPALATR